MVADGTVAAGDGVPEKTELLLPAADTARLRQWAGRNGLTLNTAVLFAWAVVLSRLTDRRDVVFGTIVSGRPEQLPGVETMVGLFINAVPVVHRVSRTEPVVEQCARLQRESSAMRDIGYLSLSELQREHGRGTLFDSLFVFENAPIEDAIREVTETGRRPLFADRDGKPDALPADRGLAPERRRAGRARRGDSPGAATSSAGPRSASVCLPCCANSPISVTTTRADALDILTSAERAEFSDLATVSVPPGHHGVGDVRDAGSRHPGRRRIDHRRWRALHLCRTARRRQPAGGGAGRGSASARKPSSRWCCRAPAAPSSRSWRCWAPAPPICRSTSRCRPLASNPFCARRTRRWPSPRPTTRNWSGGLPALMLDDPAVAERISRLPATAAGGAPSSRAQRLRHLHLRFDRRAQGRRRHQRRDTRLSRRPPRPCLPGGLGAAGPSAAHRARLVT